MRAAQPFKYRTPLRNKPFASRSAYQGQQELDDYDVVLPQSSPARNTWRDYGSAAQVPASGVRRPAEAPLNDLSGLFENVSKDLGAALRATEKKVKNAGKIGDGGAGVRVEPPPPAGAFNGV